MILTNLAYIQNAPRIFYGLKENGRPFFKNESTPYHSMNGIGNKYESELDSEYYKILIILVIFKDGSLRFI